MKLAPTVERVDPNCGVVLVHFLADVVRLKALGGSDNWFCSTACSSEWYGRGKRGADCGTTAPDRAAA